MGVAAVLILMQLPVQVSLRIRPKGLSEKVVNLVVLLRGEVFAKWRQLFLSIVLCGINICLSFIYICIYFVAYLPLDMGYICFCLLSPTANIFSLHDPKKRYWREKKGSGGSLPEMGEPRSPIS